MVKNWKDIPHNIFNQNGMRQVFTGENAMLVMNTLEPGFPPFPHNHPHEQIVLILEGRCEMIVEDKVHPMKSGDMIVIPPNAHHDIRIIGDQKVVNLDIFTPIREDYL